MTPSLLKGKYSKKTVSIYYSRKRIIVFFFFYIDDTEQITKNLVPRQFVGKFEFHIFEFPRHNMDFFCTVFRVIRENFASAY